MEPWRSAAAGAAVFAWALFAASAGAEPADGGADGQEGEDKHLETLVVTGTRLTSDPTARIFLITAEDIARKGLSSTEEIIRSIPHNFSTINSFNNLDFGSDVLDANLGALGLGVSSANLRGLGSRNTLVLVNGRRIAGVAGQEELFANIRHVPAAAIERVEVLLDGGGSIYGSDAIGGVINLVMRQNFTGGSVSGRQEVSSTGGDLWRVSGQYGQSWDGGNISATLSQTTSDPVLTRKTGFTTRDYRPIFGDDPIWNFVGTSNPRSAAIGTSRWGGRTLMLPRGNDGRNAQPADFAQITPDDYMDIIPRDIGSAKEDRSIFVYARQEFADSFTLSAEVLRTVARSHTTRTTFGIGALVVPPSNAFNNFGREVFIDYDMSTEVALGLIPPPRQTDLTTQARYVIGLEHAISPRLLWGIDYVESTSRGKGAQWMFAPQGGRFSRLIDDPALNTRLAELMASSDPAQAPNLFGDGTGQNETIREFFVPYAGQRDESGTRALEFKVRSNAYELPGGWINIVGGAELREEALEDLDSDFEIERGTGLRRPTRDLTAYFAEVLMPIFSPRNESAWFRQLHLKIAARYDRYETKGAYGDLPQPDPMVPAMPNIITAKFSNVAPELGLHWEPVQGLEFRIKRSEGFRAPTFSQLFGRFRLNIDGTTFDPLTGTFVNARFEFGSNPDLKPEVSTTDSIGVRYLPSWGDGLLVTVDWSDVDIRDRLATSNSLRQLLPVEVYAFLPQFFLRGEDGTLIAAFSTTINISRRVSKSVDLHISKPFDTEVGRFVAQLDYSRVLEQYDQAIPGTAKGSLVGESVGVDRYKLKAEGTWYRDPSSVTVVVNHTPGYINNDFENTFFRSEIPRMPVSSHTTVDVSAAHRFESGVSVRVGGRNVFDRGFPFMLSAQGRPYDSKRVDLRGRVLYLELGYEFHGN